MCEVSPCGDATEALLRVTCSDLSKELNAELSRLENVNREIRRELLVDIGSLPLKVALDGPLTMDKWRSWRDYQAHRR